MFFRYFLAFFACFLIVFYMLFVVFSAFEQSLFSLLVMFSLQKRRAYVVKYYLPFCFDAHRRRLHCLRFL